jgi:hypothetical protein
MVVPTKISSLMVCPDKNDCQLSAEKGRLAFFLARWRGQLLIDQTEGDADGIELDKRVLDYYLDQYNELATFHSPPSAGNS